MAYSTGTVADAAALLSSVQAFATANGWTLTGNVLSKGNSYTSVTVGSTTSLHVQGCLDTGFSVGVAPYYKQINIRAASWPIIYHLFTFTNPDMLFLVCQFDVDWCQLMFFGDIVKVNAAAYTGGNLFWASRDLTASPTFSGGMELYPDRIYLTNSATTGTDMYVPYTSETFKGVNNSGFYCTIDGNTWILNGVSENKIFLSKDTAYALYRTPNTWNQQTPLLPINLMFSMLNNYKGYLGYIEHMRYLRIDNYNIGDIITLGTDRWKVFSFKSKDTINRNGILNATTDYYTVSGCTVGTLGYVIRYDGP